MQRKTLQSIVAATTCAVMTSFAGAELIFDLPMLVELRNRPSGVAAMDFDHDGLMDLVVVNGQPARAEFFMNLGSDGFVEGGSILLPKGSDGASMTAGDITGDGRNELLFVCPNSQLVHVLFNSDFAGPIWIATAPTGADPHGAIVGDVDNNGLGDIIVANTGSNTLNVILNPILPGMTVRTLRTGAGPLHVALGDVDVHKNRGRDLIVTHRDDRSILVFRNMGHGEFGVTERLSTMASIPDGVGVADMNGDGANDIVAAISGRPDDLNGVMTFMNTGGTFGKPERFDSGGTGTCGLSLADMDNDGATDIIATNHVSGTFSILGGFGNGGFKLDFLMNVGLGPDDVLTVDLDSDGDMDVVTLDVEGQAVTVLYNLLNVNG